MTSKNKQNLNAYFLFVIKDKINTYPFKSCDALK